MAVFRVERNKGYTVMSNHHLRNKELSLKAKGLLSQMLSLPEDWDYTLKGLCAPCAFPRMSFPLCFPGAVFRVWKPRRATPQNPQTMTPKKWRTPRMNKKILRTLTALCAALVLMGGFSVTAFAQTPEGEDDTNDSGVVYEEPQKEEPLTPDGNATLVDDFGGNKQLITVTTKNGNYFYILIDRDDEGEDTVHFLNQVDEADLLALMEDGSTEAAPPAVCSCTDKCEAGKVNVSCPVCKDNMIDGIINNTPTVDELEAKVKAGEQISLVDLANAVKADKERGKGAKPEKKPSIRAQLRADKEKAQKKNAKQKSQDLERS